MYEHWNSLQSVTVSRVVSISEFDQGCEIEFYLLLLMFHIVIAVKILPVVKNQHLLLCTLLICNAAAMEVSVCVCFCVLHNSI